MKFCKKYQQFMQEQHKELPGVGFKKLKKILKRCRRRRCVQETQGSGDAGGGSNADDDAVVRNSSPSSSSSCPHSCTVCDGTFFSSLLNEMSAVVGFFNERAQKLLELHLASGFQKWLLYFKNKQQKNHGALIQEGNNLVTYAMINAVAIRKILKKYDKVHYSKQGQAFKSQAQNLHIEILQSPWLCELIAFHINLRETKGVTRTLPALFERFSLTFEDDKPSLSCALFDSVKLDIELTCSVCLDTVFDPVSLTCGHIFCYICACSSASVTTVDGLKAADRKAKCPLCREARVFEGAVHLEELTILLSRSCPQYWKERLQSERVERLKQAKEYWESQYQSVMGI